VLRDVTLPSKPVQVDANSYCLVQAPGDKVIRNLCSSCYLCPFGFTSSKGGFRIRNDEVVGSIPTSSTIVSNEVPSCQKKRHSRVARCVCCDCDG
jgi:hypothetical protein